MERSARERLGSTTDVQTMVVSSRTVEVIDGDFFPLPDTLPLHDSDVRAIRGVPGVESATRLLEGRREVRLVGAATRRMATLRALEGSGRAPRLAHGRALGADDEPASPHGVISHLLARRLAPARDSVRTLLDRTLLVGADSVRIVGIMAEQPGEMMPSLQLPYGRLEAILSGRGPLLPSVVVRARSIEDVAPVKRAIEDIVQARTPQWTRQFEVATYAARASQMAQGILIFKLLMGAITGISLLVGGIGIMNVLLASVSERTREIGIRRAAGATRQDILLQFLSESVAISGFGSVLGVVLGLLGAFGITAAIRRFSSAVFVQASFSWSSVLAAAAASVVIGLLFGVYPARRAAWLSPIDAIRHE
jgi:putative ABC transport system permease protein